VEVVEFLVQMKMEMTVVLVVVHQVVDLLEMVVLDRSGHLMLQVILAMLLIRVMLVVKEM
tara:strand:- start:289 stop:468 length:180 start_codon:yes stop_codon:yes gene_type:complete